MIEIFIGLVIGCLLGIILYEYDFIITACISLCIIFSVVMMGNSANGHISGRIDERIGGSSSYRENSIALTEFPKSYFNRDDSSHTKIEYNYEDDVNKILQTGKFPAVVSHYYIKNTTKSKKFNRILNLKDTMPYKKRFGSYKAQLHWGQLKLFLSEVEFLTLATKENKTKEIIFIYVGAAPGDHIEYLSSLFPHVRFELYDLTDFVCRENDKIKLHKQYFTNEDAHKWASFIKKNPNKYVALCSDIRQRPVNSENIAQDMNLQLGWWKLINPDISMLKFHLSPDEAATEYPKGDIYIQLYARATSIETRLIIRKNAPIIKYNNTDYCKALYKHNKIYRPAEHTKFKGYVLDKCYDCAGFEFIVSDYLKLTGKLTNKTLLEMIQDIQNKITHHNRNIKNRTITNIIKMLDTYYRLQYKPCGKTYCRICPSGAHLNMYSSTSFYGS